MTSAFAYRASVCLIVFCCAVFGLHAQVASTGAISGTVSDNSGAAVPGAIITITNQATQVKRSVTSNDTGFYSAESLLAGNYEVAIQKAGFKETVIRDLVLAPGQRF